MNWRIWLLNQLVDNHLCSWIIYSDEHRAEIGVMAWGHVYIIVYE